MPNAEAADQNRSDAPFTEELAALFDGMGWKPLVARTLGELLLAEEAHLSTVQLCQRICVSKSHLSSAIQQLEAAGYIERFGKVGTRQHFFRLRSNAFAHAMQDSLTSVRRMAELADGAIATVPAGSRAAHELGLMAEFYRFIEVRFADVATEFLAKHPS